MISARDVRKSYGSKAALDGFDLEVSPGTVFGLLGPNGAGKTTAIRILSTLMRLDSGSAQVAGFDVRTQGRQVRKHIGVVGQYAAVDEILSGEQNLVMFGRLNGLSFKAAKSRSAELLEQFSLADTGSKPAAQYSGGMRRRLDLAASLIVAPKVLFVDEPTTGLDPQARQEVWAAVRQLVAQGTTILLTTQYLEEADQLASHIGMLWHGRIVRSGTPSELKSATGTEWIDLHFGAPADAARAAALLGADALGDLVSIPAADGTRALVEVAGMLAAQGMQPEQISLRRPTLDEVFMQISAEYTEVAA